MQLYSISGTINLQNVTWDLQVPHHLAVTNTDRAKLVFNADLLGSTIEVFLLFIVRNKVH